MSVSLLLSASDLTFSSSVTSLVSLIPHFHYFPSFPFIFLPNIPVIPCCCYPFVIPFLCLSFECCFLSPLLRHVFINILLHLRSFFHCFDFSLYPFFLHFSLSSPALFFFPTTSSLHLISFLILYICSFISPLSLLSPYFLFSVLLSCPSFRLFSFLLSSPFFFHMTHLTFISANFPQSSVPLFLFLYIFFTFFPSRTPSSSQFAAALPST